MKLLEKQYKKPPLVIIGKGKEEVINPGLAQW